MGRTKGLRNLVVDLVGGATVSALAFVFVWLTLIRADGTALRVKELTQAAATARQDLAQTRATRRRLQTVLTDRRAELKKTGRLPDQAPVEKYFQTLSRLAKQHQLRVVRHNPIASRAYPGLFERRFGYEVTGTMLDLTRFLRAIEETDYWADVSYFKIDQRRKTAGGAVNERVAELTLSLFSALPTRMGSSE